MNTPELKLDKGRGKNAPLYKQVCDHLAAQIKAGRFAAGDRLPPVSKLVKKWNVNYQTINIALAALEKQGLIRCEPGRGKGPMVLVGSAQKFSMMFVRWNNEGYPMEICEGIRRFTEEKEIRFSIAHYTDCHKSLADVIARLPEGSSGLIMVPMHSPEFVDACRMAVDRGVKIILVDERLDNLPASAVSVDHAGGAHQATLHLLKLHGGPVCCFGATSHGAVQERVSGWASAMSQYGFADYAPYIYKCPDVDPTQKMPGSHELRNSYEMAKKMLKSQKEMPFSVFTCTGYAAQGLYKAAAEAKLQIGKDIFVAGFGDDAFCHKLPVQLTRIKQSWEMLGYEAASILLAEMSGVVGHSMYHLLPAKLEIHESSVGEE